MRDEDSSSPGGRPQAESQEIEARPSTAGRRGIEIFSDSVGDTVTPAVTALLATAAVVTKNPELAVFSVPAGALTGALGKQGALVAAGAIRERVNRVRRFIAAVEKEANEPIDDFIADTVDEDATWVLLGLSVDAVTDSKSAWRIKVLAKAFVRGARDGDRIDETTYFIPLLRDFDPAHARLLAAVKKHPQDRFQTIKESDSGLGPSTAILVKHLVDAGLLLQFSEDGTEWSGELRLGLTDIGSACTDWLEELGIELSQADEKGDPSGARDSSEAR